MIKKNLFSYHGTTGYFKGMLLHFAKYLYMLHSSMYFKSVSWYNCGRR